MERFLKSVILLGLLILSIAGFFVAVVGLAWVFIELASVLVNGDPFCWYSLWAFLGGLAAFFSCRGLFLIWEALKNKKD